MKKTVKFLSVVLAAVVVLTVSVIPASAAPKGYAFRYKKATTYIDAKASSFIKKAGRYKSKKKSKACAYKGEENTYTYNSFVLVTYSNKKGGTDYVESIEFTSKKAKTSEGIGIGSSDRDIREAYGGTVKNGMNTYKKGNMALKVKVRNHKVSSVMYIKA